MVASTAVHGSSSRLSQTATARSISDRAPVSQTDQDRSNRGDSAGDDMDRFHIEDFPTDSQGHLASVQTVKPYSIEEPDEAIAEHETDPPRQEQQSGAWDSLIDSMKDLHCDSDNSASQSMPGKRGRKRKSTNVPSGPPQADQSCPSVSTSDVYYQGPSLSSKRRRRKSKPSKSSLKGSHADYIDPVQESSGVSDNSLSTDTSDANHTSGSTAPDEMDID
ncbi:hypothetical protein BJX61DRAFT_416958 [Aspergillus egyptiacus]|nr:hypothetical protein BJX61DRAFT_416958 [Aspergillus egyptiacus]